MAKGLISIGGAYIDVNAPNFPFEDVSSDLKDQELVGNEYVFELGGSAVNFARLCVALEIPATFVGKVGKDRLGIIFSELLNAAGIQSGLVIDESKQTNMSFNMVSPSGKSQMNVVGSANQALTSEEVYSKVSDLLNQADYLFIGGCFKLTNLMPAFVRLASGAKAKNVKVIVDHARMNDRTTEEEKEAVRKLALIADIYLPSAGEFTELWGVNTIEEGLALLQQKGFRGLSVVKDSKDGAVTMIDNILTRIEAFNVRPVHTIGAGDSFNAGFIAAINKGQDLIDSIKFACATAALKISSSTLPTYSDTVKFIQNYQY